MSPSAEPTSQGAEATTHPVPVGLIEDGEIVILAVKPSAWFALIVSLPVLASAAVVGVVAYVVELYHPAMQARLIWPGCAAVALVRMLIACWQWLGRTYVLTNRRVVCIRGLIRVQWAAAALAKVQEAVLTSSIAERIVGTGSIYCLADMAGSAAVAWNTVARPADVHEIVLEAVNRARRADSPTAGAR